MGDTKVSVEFMLAGSKTIQEFSVPEESSLEQVLIEIEKRFFKSLKYYEYITVEFGGEKFYYSIIMGEIVI